MLNNVTVFKKMHFYQSSTKNRNQCWKNLSDTLFLKYASKYKKSDLFDIT